MFARKCCEVNEFGTRVSPAAVSISRGQPPVLLQEIRSSGGPFTGDKEFRRSLYRRSEFRRSLYRRSGVQEVVLQEFRRSLYRRSGVQEIVALAKHAPKAGQPGGATRSQFCLLRPP
jgi:hypothetical protein